MEDSKTRFLEGEIILIDKEYQWTSFDVVKKIRNIIRVRKVGHAGTLDPLATGLLILCTGKKTKQINNIQALSKEYEGSLFLGAVRPSYDKETEIIKTRPISDISSEKILNIADTFTGEVDQVPPSYSAIRKGGKRMYELARQGKEVNLEPRKVKIHDFEITGIDLPVVSFRLKCSKGFYVRSLARDFGEKLGCGAFLNDLRRTAIGHYRVEDAIRVGEFEKSIRA